MEFARPARRIESFSCFSDGIENLVLHYATKTVHDPFFNAMIEPVRASTATGLDALLSESLVRYLSAERVCDRTDDDKSLVLATRSTFPPSSIADASS